MVITVINLDIYLWHRNTVLKSAQGKNGDAVVVGGPRRVSIQKIRLSSWEGRTLSRK